MPMKEPEQKSTVTSANTDWLDLHLPAVTSENAPVDHPSPSSRLAYAHSKELLRSLPDHVWEDRRRFMNPERFVLR